MMQRFAMVPAVLVVVVVTIATTTAASFKDAFAPSFSNPPRSRSLVQQHQVARGADTDDFASFAAALEADAEEQKQQQQTSVQSSSIHNSNNNRQATTKTTTKIKKKTWQADLERLMDPTTPSSQRQILLSDLVNANAEIRASVEAALRDRNIDPLLTPTGRKLQDGTRAVARQLTNDILPSLGRPIRMEATSSSSSSSSSTLPFPLPALLPKPEDFSRLGIRVLNAVSNQLQRNLETLQTDLANPSRIPERLAKQTEDFWQEAGNIFSETPVGLKEPAYTLAFEGTDYEVRDYQAYTVATTSMDDTSNSPAGAGVAFNTLATYIFGANVGNKVMEMTTPVATTMAGEMRFYVEDTAPNPLPEDVAAANTTPWYDASSSDSRSKIRLERVPAARLAVRRFAGFATAGEVARQKEALLAALALDANTVELDVPHGQAVGHLVFQYNPPYTLPVLRRNEIAVPVIVLSESINDDNNNDDDQAAVVKPADNIWTSANGSVSA